MTHQSNQRFLDRRPLDLDHDLVLLVKPFAEDHKWVEADRVIRETKNGWAIAGDDDPFWRSQADENGAAVYPEPKAAVTASKAAEPAPEATATPPAAPQGAGR